MIVLFKALTLTEIQQTVDPQLAGVYARLARRRIRLELTAAASELIARPGGVLQEARQLVAGCVVLMGFRRAGP